MPPQPSHNGRAAVSECTVQRTFHPHLKISNDNMLSIVCIPHRLAGPPTHTRITLRSLQSASQG